MIRNSIDTHVKLHTAINRNISIRILDHAERKK